MNTSKYMISESLARADRVIRPLLVRGLPSWLTTLLYSHGRQFFLNRFVLDIPNQVYTPDPELERTCWGVKFRFPLFNAAGMFKNGEGYPVVARQGAGAYLAGTTTANARLGNVKKHIQLPFVSYPASGAASNWLGLPNEGDSVVAARLNNELHLYRCPIGASTMSSPDFEGNAQLEKLVTGMRAYERAGVDFIEWNDSCPNTNHDSSDFHALIRRVQYVKEHFLDQRIVDTIHRTRPVPVIWKPSPDISSQGVSAYLDIAFNAGIDGINFANTSKLYALHAKNIAPSERRLYEYYTKTFGGGVSGRPLTEISLELAASAVEYLRAGPPSHEFHVIRTGGIFGTDDLLDSDADGVSLNEWFTGYLDAFAQHGHQVYETIHQKYLQEKRAEAVVL